ncbi:hypothetical protein OIO90_003966 [Microbotryomycetes sp. JL221]|nr:hypothetical protein OIO90_003966 [Microbotryomycetes sp. JL221]
MDPSNSSRRAAFGGRLTSSDSTTTSSSNLTTTTRQRDDSINSVASPTAVRSGQDASSMPHNKGQARRRSHEHQQRQQQTIQPSAAALAAYAKSQQRSSAAHNNGQDQDDANQDEDDEGAVCFICAEVVQLWALGECNHRTCHTCSIRLRALYKKKECTFCKTELPRVIFTVDSDKPYSEYSPTSLPFSDSKLGISFETREQLDDSIALLRFNCPELTCEDVRQSWPDLKRHVKAAHQTSICDLCSFNKKIFAHEHTLYNQADMRHHLQHDHTQCDFCRRNFYDSDQLYAHCRDKHEECFICIRQGIRHQYHLNYEQLEAHFKSAHFICPHPDCLQQKFVVFESELDLQAHAVEVHGTALADQKARKEARRIETNFTYQTATEASRSSGNGRNNRRGGAADSSRRDRHAGGSQQQQPAAAFVRTAEDSTTSRGNRIVPGLGAAANAAGRRAGFGSSLTERASNPASGSSETDAEIKAQHEAVMRKVYGAVSSEAKITSFKLAIRSYKAGEVSADDLADQLWNIFDQKEDVAGPIVAGVADLFTKDDAEKRIALVTAWHDLRDQQNQFPSLAPLDPTLPTTSTRHVTSRTLNNRSTRQSRPAVWDRVEQAAASTRIGPTTNPFPALKSAPNANSVPGVRSKTSHTSTPWLAHATPSSSTPSSGLPSRSSTPVARPTPYSASAPKPAALTGSYSNTTAASKAAAAGRAAAAPSARSGLEFPALPTSTVEADKRARIRAALSKPNGTIVDDLSPGADRRGSSALDDFSWGASSSSASSNGQQAQAATGGTGGGKKNKKGKVLLMSHGSMRG